MPAAFDDLIATVPLGAWINGQSRPASSGETFDVHNPATGEVLASVADATVDDVADAVAASNAVADEWAATPPRVRADILRRAFDLVIERRDQFALLITLEMGKPVAESVGEVNYGAEFLRWFSEEAVRINGRVTTAPSGNGQIVVTKEPVGLCLAVTPWNFPLAMGTRKIGPALAAGCTMIVKPSEDTPLTMLLLAKTLAEAGLPAGVLSVLPTMNSIDVVAALLHDPAMAKVSFTGSTQVGKILLAQAADQVLRTSMELGGNAPFLVFDDADLDGAVEGAVAAKMRNGGEACTAANRILVQNSVREEFTARLAARIGAMNVGPGWEDGSAVGPIVNDRQRSRIAALVDEAAAGGANVRTGGRSLDGPGSFYAPTVVDNIPAGSAILTEEIFGPVAAIVGFESEEDGITLANSTDYGLASYFYATDIARIQRVARRLRAGMVGVNRGVISDPAAPFGGIKQSGLGSEGGSEGISEYLDTKYVALPPSI
ncbi:NAD-dependent succinate-semialdehyde dehydrogenase [Gordonia sp. PDNC005]|uniref:NAD-dependent succinate-semialdehyde dehydrogenase n=1 Tax=unclassified Gordonia (in: high G+C Gram-positive bacteria) TaxID=2657482 RepID=UPI001963CEE0|nr:NAD-dependent succinate-semialdehyde dehydrogenase [Gordonia sp. PDNC005]QRY61150.1 NAD-dependent succinate-semialdehyde dehydrogenase [Gordonia sp. PDNC005]